MLSDLNGEQLESHWIIIKVQWKMISITQNYVNSIGSFVFSTSRVELKLGYGYVMTSIKCVCNVNYQAMPCFNSGLNKPSFQLEHGWIIKSCDYSSTLWIWFCLGYYLWRNVAIDGHEVGALEYGSGCIESIKMCRKRGPIHLHDKFCRAYVDDLMKMVVCPSSLHRGSVSLRLMTSQLNDILNNTQK